MILHYYALPDTEDPAHFFIEQYEVQIISAIKRTLTLSTVLDATTLATNIAFVLLTKGVVTEKGRWCVWGPPFLTVCRERDEAAEDAEAPEHHAAAGREQADGVWNCGGGEG